MGSEGCTKTVPARLQGMRQ